MFGEMAALTDLQGCKLQTAPTRIMCNYDPIHINKNVDEITDKATCDEWMTTNMATFGCDYTNDTGDIDIAALKAYLESYDADSYMVMADDPDWDFDVIFKDTTFANLDEFNVLAKSLLGDDDTNQVAGGYTLALSVFALVSSLSILV